ncbi:hypothetical protein H7U37_05905 [Pseudoflavonifractor phocaeensis]|uniref:hypothetical protein n=1 Tax=Pseudoflavonifractor phocaeensis TaxID=1870988 RepID=UPI0019565465|nr:hypothetical protein [Pseudoflavonifractor phocaeensis]MBM6938069.1 hypothetical protein [Pseudoflavonifractor phocaeensis]
MQNEKFAFLKNGPKPAQTKMEPQKVTKILGLSGKPDIGKAGNPSELVNCPLTADTIYAKIIGIMFGALWACKKSFRK